VAYYRVWSGEELLFSGVSLMVFSRAYSHSKKAAWFPRATHITINWYDTHDEASLAQETSVDREKPLFWAGGGTSWIRSGDGYADTSALSPHGAQSQKGVPPGYYRDSGGTLHSKREARVSPSDRRGLIADPAGSEVVALRLRVRQLEIRLSKLDICITPGCRGKITSLERRMCGRCYNRAWHAEQAEKAVRERRTAEERRRMELLRGRPEVYQRWVMRCILEDLNSKVL